MRTVLLVVAMALAVAPAFADVTTSVDMLDPSDGVSLPPNGITCFDVYIDTVDAPGFAWTAGGLHGEVTPIGEQWGVALRYAAIPDPNTPRPHYLVEPPGEDHRFVTFMTRPRPRDAAIRYTNSGAGIAGGYSPVDPIGTATATEINIAWFASPPETASSPGIDGYVARIVLETGNITGIGAGHFLPPDVVVLFESVTSEGLPGTVSASFDNPALSGTDWYVWATVPEPASIAVLGLATGAVLCRRRTRNP